ncbi:MAG: sugar phosphate isomerase/epimerase [Lacunisphaera sp.]|nr:sugar phosphate isomerase/epimerase [Lacunisphaera sp.]
MNAFGVSPAFVFSRHTTAFTPTDYCTSLPVIRGLGFTAYQPEVYFAATLPAWAGGGARAVQAEAARCGLQASQFVAHFMLEGFTNAARLAAVAADVELFKQAAAIAQGFPGCKVVTVALGAFQVDPADAARPGWYAEQQDRLADKISACLAVATGAGLQLALEIMPFSLLGNSDGFLRLLHTLGSPAGLGVNLDTGHAWAGRELMEVLPWKLRGRIFGTHLTDNNSDQNSALAPGQGTIPWAPFLRALRASGYTGSLDLEIACPPDQVTAEYTNGRNYLQSLNLA